MAGMRTVFALMFVGSCVMAADPVSPGVKPLIGTWEIKSFTDDRPDDTRGMGRLGVTPVKEGQPPKIAKLVCTGAEIFVIRGNGQRDVLAGLTNCAWGQFKIDDSTNPKSIDLWCYQADPAAKEKIYKGIYEINGKTLKICWGETSPIRPTKIETDAHNNTFICEKLSDEPEKPKEAPKPPAPKPLP